MTAVLLTLGGITVTLLVVLLFWLAYREPPAARRRRAMLAEQVAVQARISWLTQQTLTAMRDAVRQELRNRRGGDLQ